MLLNAASLRRTRRGMTLVATVILATIASGVSLVVLRQSLLSARVESAAADSQDAKRLAELALASVETKLAADPWFFYSSVYSGIVTYPDTASQVAVRERKRQCVGGSTHNPADPFVTQDLAAFPGSCGTSWTYVKADDSSNPARDQARVEIIPPSPSDPRLTVRVVANYGTSDQGVTAHYVLNGAGRFTAWSAQDLRLDSLCGGYACDPATATANKTRVAGQLYSAADVYLPANSSVVLYDTATASRAQVAAEGDIIGAPTDNGVRYYAANPSPGGGGLQPVRSVRELVAAPLGIADLANSMTQVADIACRQPGGQANVGQRSAQLCLKAGAQVREWTGSSVVTVPANVTAYLLLPGRDGAGTVTVYAATTAPSFTGDCAVRCDLMSLAAREVAAGTHPGAISLDGTCTGCATPFWNSGNRLGVFYLPVSGVIATDADTYVGVCGYQANTPRGFAAYGSTCFPRTSGYSAAGSTADTSFTLVAGRPEAPRDVYLGAPLHVANNARVGIVASGSVLLPYWARPSGAGAGNVLRYQALLAALGGGNVPPGASAIRSIPFRLDPPTRSDDPNYAESLQLVGGVAAPRLDLGFAGFRTANLTSDPRLRQSPPPTMPGLVAAWDRLSSVPLSGAELCGLRNCRATF